MSIAEEPDPTPPLPESPRAAEGPFKRDHDGGFGTIGPFYAEDATFPKGFWHSVDYLLQHPQMVLDSIVHDRDLWRLKGTFLVVSIFMCSVYGATMGATNLLQGSTMPLYGKFAMVAITSFKVTTLLLLTLVIVIPPIYVSNAFVGSRFSFKQLVALLLAGCAVTSTVLASLATVAFFFSLTTSSYYFVKLMHVAFFVYAGALGLQFVMTAFRAVAFQTGRHLNYGLVFLWILLYAFVGTQLAWVMRPFIGRPDMAVTIFREREGNFYENIADSFSKFMEGRPQRSEQKPPAKR